MGDWSTAPRTWAAAEVVTAANLNAQLRDFAKAFGAFTAYTPTLAGFTLGNGATTGFYLRAQKLVIFRASFVFGSTSAAASAVPTLTLPVTASANNPTLGEIGQGTFLDSGVATYSAVARLVSTTTVGLLIPGTNGIHNTPSATTPFTWGTGDSLTVWGSYEAA